MNSTSNYTLVAHKCRAPPGYGWARRYAGIDALLAGSPTNAVSLEFYSRDTIQRECLRLSRTGHVHPSAVPAMPVAIAEVIEVLDTPFSGGAAPFDMCVVVQALVV